MCDWDLSLDIEYGCDVDMRPMVLCGWKRIDPSLTLSFMILLVVAVVLLLFSCRISPSEEDDDVVDDDITVHFSRLLLNEFIICLFSLKRGEHSEIKPSCNNSFVLDGDNE